MGKKLVELLLCILHPVAVVLMWINLVSRTDLTTVGKLAWAIFGLIPLVPFLYVLTGGDLSERCAGGRTLALVIALGIRTSPGPGCMRPRRSAPLRRTELLPTGSHE